MFAECCVFSKQSQPPGHCNPHQLWRASLLTKRGVPSPEVTVPICLVPSPEFSQVGFSPHPPVLVYGTVRCYLKLRRFSWKHGINHFPVQRPVVSYLDIKSPDLPKLSAYILSPGQPSPGRFSLLRPSIAVTPSTGILTSFPSTTPFGLALGADSPYAD